jgi:hypothetical protein
MRANDRISRAHAVAEAIRVWALRQGEPFETTEVMARFRIAKNTAVKLLAPMVSEGKIRARTQASFNNPRTYEVTR